MKPALHLALTCAILSLPCLSVQGAPVQALPPAAQAAALLKDALFAEETQGQTDTAMKLYQQIADEAEALRPYAGTALVRMGEIARKQNRVDDARRYYSRALTFELTSTAAALCRTWLQAMGGPLTSPPRVAAVDPITQWPGASRPQPSSPAPPSELLLRLKKQLQTLPSALFTPSQLSGAVEKGDLDAIRFLLDHGVDVNAMTLGGNDAALLVALRSRQWEAMKLLAERGARLDVQDPRGAGIMHSLAWDRHAEMTRYFLSKGARPDTMAPGLQETRGVRLPIGTPLHVIAMQGSAEVAELLLGPGGADPNVACPESGHTPLHTAARFDQSETARVFLAHGAKTDLRYTGSALRGRTPMHEAAEFGSTLTAIALVEAGASINAPLSAEQPLTPVHLAVRGNHLEWLRAVSAGPVATNGGPEREAPDLAAVDELGDTPLHTAVRQGSAASVALIRWLIQNGASPGAKNKAGLTPGELADSPGGRQDPDISAALRLSLPASAGGVSDQDREACRAITLALPGADAAARSVLLHRYSKAGSRAGVALLLDAGVPVDSPGERNCTALVTAAAAGQTEVATLLLDRGAAINATNEEGRSALHAAMGLPTEETARLLINRGAHVNLSASGLREDGRMWNAIGTPLHEAARSGSLALCRLLMDHGADVNYAPSKTRSGVSPLIIAARHGRAGIVAALLGAGANVDAIAGLDLGPEAGTTALHQAAWFGHVEAMAVLLGAGADINHRKIPGTNRFTPFMLLIRENHYEAAHQLCLPMDGKPALAAPDLSLTDSEGDTALHVAVRSYSKAAPDFISWLIARGAPLEVKNHAGLTPAALAAAPELGRSLPEISALFQTTPTLELLPESPMEKEAPQPSTPRSAPR